MEIEPKIVVDLIPDWRRPNQVANPGPVLVVINNDGDACHGTNVALLLVDYGKFPSYMYYNDKYYIIQSYDAEWADGMATLEAWTAYPQLSHTIEQIFGMVASRMK